MKIEELKSGAAEVTVALDEYIAALGIKGGQFEISSKKGECTISNGDGATFYTTRCHNWKLLIRDGRLDTIKFTVYNASRNLIKGY